MAAAVHNIRKIRRWEGDCPKELFTLPTTTDGLSEKAGDVTLRENRVVIVEKI